MKDERILITGASGQIGSVLSKRLIEKYGSENIICSDIIKPKEVFGIYESIDVTQIEDINQVIKKYDIQQVYHLAAILSAKGEMNPAKTWNINMNGLLNILEACKEHSVSKIFVPSSIAVFGNESLLDLTTQYSFQDPGTVYGISKSAGELWCQYYFDKYSLDIRSIRYPGLISYQSPPGGGTTDYAVDMFYGAIQDKKYTCYLDKDTRLPMMYMEDAIEGTLQIMNASTDQIKIRSSYNFASMNFTPEELAQEIKTHIPQFKVDFRPDHRQMIADAWPDSIDDTDAQKDWNWKANYNLNEMVKSMIENIEKSMMVNS